MLKLTNLNTKLNISGWGSETDSDVNPYHFLDKIKLSTPTQIDRWVVDIEYDFKVLSKHFHKNRQIFMYNYISIGVDSLITLNFHRARESKFYIFSHRIINKLMYFLYGSQQVGFVCAPKFFRLIIFIVLGISSRMPGNTEFNWSLHRQWRTRITKFRICCIFEYWFVLFLSFHSLY